MQKEAVASRLRIAITQLIVDDWRLLTTTEQDRAGTANEVAVAFALGWHLRPLLDRRWDVDCEYNRATDHDGIADVKRRSSGERVYPDLLVHRRRERGSENNLLVLELKTNSVSQRHQGGSHASVADLVDRHRYQHGVFVDLGIAHRAVYPQWAWYEARNGEEPGVWTEMRPVYSEPTLAAIVNRAKLEDEGRYH